MITSVSITHFKAIKDCLNLPLQPFTAFVGNNGSGKSSVIEALRVLQIAATQNVETAFTDWGGLDKVRNYYALQDEPSISMFGFKQVHQPILIRIECILKEKKFEYQVSFNLTPEGDYYVVENEELFVNGQPLILANAIDNKGTSFCQLYVSADGVKEYSHGGSILMISLKDGNPFFLHPDVALFQSFVVNWQFLYLNAHVMGKPIAMSRSYRPIRLDYDGRNIAEYILWIRAQGQEYLDTIIKKMLFVLPYIKQIQPNIQDIFTREVELLLIESHQKSQPIPGWLLSSGTLRILALLSVFDSPNPPSALFVDEIENGLDPRTIGLLLNQIRNETTSREMQVIITTHSPFLLDILPIESIIVAEKSVDKCTYTIPASNERLKIWVEKFTPGKLFTSGKFSR